MLETKVNTVKGAKVVSPLNDLIKDSVKEVIKTPEQIKEEILKLQSLLPQKVKKETPEYILERQLFSNEIKAVLFNFGTVQRAANKLLTEQGEAGFIKKLSEKQKVNFVTSRLNVAIKSKVTLLKVTNKGNDILSLTPSHYLRLVISFCTLTSKEYDKRKATK